MLGVKQKAAEDKKSTEFFSSQMLRRVSFHVAGVHLEAETILMPRNFSVKNFFSVLIIDS